MEPHTPLRSDHAQQPISGHAAGVPFLAVPPGGAHRASAPLVLAWHLLDAPRTEVAFASALPLKGLDAWRVYLGLPLCGSRLPSGGFEVLERRAATDAVLELYEPIVDTAVAELPAALAALREQLEIDAADIGLLGGSVGAAVALLALTDTPVDARAAVLASPLVQLRPAVDAAADLFGVTYPWTEQALAVASRLDFVARAEEVAARSAAVMLVVGAEDGAQFHEPAGALHAELRARGAKARLETVPGMAHGLADEPGTEPVGQLPHAAVVDRLAVDWFRRHLLA